MRMNLNQQSSGANWETHKNLLRSTSPIVDCGVHYVDVMCRMTGSRPVSVTGIGARLTDEIAPGQINYGHLQVTFADGSVGLVRGGLGPDDERDGVLRQGRDRAERLGQHRGEARPPARAGRRISARTRRPRRCSCTTRRSARTANSHGATSSSRWTTSPDHDELCRREQELFLRAIREDADLTAHWQGAYDSLRIVLAADQSFREGRTIAL